MSNVGHSASASIATLIRWGARILSALILLFWGFFIVAHLLGDEGRSSRPLMTRDYIIMTAMVISLAGLGVAWKWELIGAAMTLGVVSIGAFANWRAFASPLALIPFTAILFLLCWSMGRTRIERPGRIPEPDAEP